MILRSYQRGAVDFLQPRPRGFIHSPAGSGKTIIAAVAAAQKLKPGQKCSWLANTTDQVDQAVKALCSVEGPPDVEFDVCCAAGAPDVSDSDLVIFDESHHLPALSWTDLAEQTTGTVWGFSATPWSTDEERNAQLRDFFGGEENFYVIPRELVMAGGHLAPGRVIFHDLDAPGLFDADIKAKVEIEVARRCRRFWTIPKFEHERRATWQITQETVQQNRTRNAHAVVTANAGVKAGRSVLALVGSIEHGEELAAQVPGSVLAFSKMGAKKRRAAISAFRAGELKCLFATSLADEGLDCPVASELILLAGGRAAGKVEQRTGRVMRPYDGKTEGIVHDYLDRGAKFAFAQALARNKTYSALGYEVEFKKY